MNIQGEQIPWAKAIQTPPIHPRLLNLIIPANLKAIWAIEEYAITDFKSEKHKQR
jgi:hypothetical protein